MKTYEALPGSHVRDAISEMVKMANECGEIVTGDFNGITIVAEVGSDPVSLESQWEAEVERQAEVYRNSPEGKKHAQEREEYQKRLEAAIAEGILPFTVADTEAWKAFVESNKEGYGAAIIRYAARWANVMENKMENGEKPSDIADKASHEADVEGITGFMYGAAVAILSKVWVHGDALRRWHNLKTQIGNEGEEANKSGGVLNPALISIGK